LPGGLDTFRQIIDEHSTISYLATELKANFDSGALRDEAAIKLALIDGINLGAVQSLTEVFEEMKETEKRRENSTSLPSLNVFHNTMRIS
jgi:hypothetical protein